MDNMDDTLPIPPDHEAEDVLGTYPAHALQRATSDWGVGWPNCQTDKQVTVAGGGVRVTCRKEITLLVARCLDETLATGYVLHQEQTGAYVCRAIRNSSPPRPSNHSWGLAIDLNWNQNPSIPSGSAPHTITAQVVAIWKRHGFNWGGDWSSPVDYMHMEFGGTMADAARFTAALTTPGGTEMGLTDAQWQELYAITKKLGAEETYDFQAMARVEGRVGPEPLLPILRDIQNKLTQLLRRPGG